jgi:hypothetical protein
MSKVYVIAVTFKEEKVYYVSTLKDFDNPDA